MPFMGRVVFVLLVGSCSQRASSRAESSRGTSFVAGAQGISPAATVTTRPPAAAGAVTAFLDLNGDARLDPFAEPSTPCERHASGWNCIVESRQITVLREEAEGRKDIYVLPRLEASDATFCLGNGSNCEREWVPEPRDAAAALSLSSCNDDDLALWVKENGVTVPVPIRPAAPLAVEASLGPIDAGGGVELRLTGQDTANLDRVLAWIGDNATPFWTSEDTLGWHDDAGDRVFTIPPDAFQACSPCEVQVAVADHERWRDTASAAMVLDVRERRFTLSKVEP